MTSLGTHRRHRPWLALTAALLTLGLVGCGSEPGDVATSPSTGSSADGAQSGGTLTFAIGNDPISVNPHGGGSGNDAQYITRQIVDSLVDQDPQTGEIVPWLATSWEINDDATEFVFTLRDDVTFSDGTAFTAQSVVNTLEDVIANGAVANAAVSFLGDYTGAEAIDDVTVQITFGSPNAPFLQALSGPGLAPIADASIATPWDERVSDGVIGTGPFVLDHYTPNTEVLLTKRDGYAWPSEVSDNPGAAYLDEVLFQVVPEPSVRTGALSSGQVDVIGGVPPQDQELISASEFALVIRANPGTTFGLTPYTAKPGVDDVAVRQAIQVALDRESIRDASVNADYAVSRSVLSDTTPGFADVSDLLAHDPEEADRLLTEAGWLLGDDGIRVKDGVRLELVLAWQTNFVANQTAVELIQQQLEAVGISVELISGTVPDLNAGEESGAYDFRHGNSSRADGDVLRTSFSSAQERPFRTADPELDALLEEQRSIVDPTARNEVLEQIQRYIIEQGLHIPTFQLTTVLATTQQVHGVWLAADSRLGSLSSAWKEQ